MLTDEQDPSADEPTLAQARPKRAAAADTDAKIQESLKAEAGHHGEEPESKRARLSDGFMDAEMGDVEGAGHSTG